MLVPRAQACSMPSGTSPLDPVEVAARRADSAAITDAIAQAQQATNSFVFRSPWDWRSAGINLMKDVARQNQQRYYPGIFPPFGGPVPREFLPTHYPPGVLTPDSSGVGTPNPPVNQGGWGVSPAAISAPVAPTSNGLSGANPSTRGPRAGRYERLGEFPGRFDAAKERSGSSAQAVAPVRAGTGGSGAGSGLIGSPFTQPIPPKGAPPASVQPAGGGTSSTMGPNGAQGFTGRAIQCDPVGAGVNILGPNTGTPPVPAPQLTIAPQPVDPPVLLQSMAPTRGMSGQRGMSGAFPMTVGCTPIQGIPTTQANATDAAVANAGQGGGIASSWWAWLLVLGLAVVIANSGDDSKPEHETTRGRAK